MLKRQYLFILLLAFGINTAFSQQDLYSKLNSFVSTQTKEVSSNRLIAINIWSVNDQNSRKINDEFDRAYKAFEFAKLKGGNNGIIILNINIENDNVNSDITLKKDGVLKSIKVPSSNSDIVALLKTKPSGYNIVFDNLGNVVYENLKQDAVFSSIQKLITR